MTTNCWWKDTFLWSLAEDKKMCAQCSDTWNHLSAFKWGVFVLSFGWTGAFMFSHKKNHQNFICVRSNTSASLRAPFALHKASVSYHDVSPAKRPVLICPVFYQSACIAVPWGDRPTCSLFVCAGRIPDVTCVTSRNKDDIVNGGEFWPLSCKRGDFFHLSRNFWVPWQDVTVDLDLSSALCIPPWHPVKNPCFITHRAWFVKML